MLRFGLRRPVVAPLAAALAAASAAAACGRDPVDPLPTTLGAARFTASTPITSRLARPFYSDTLLAWQDTVFYWRDRVDMRAKAADVRSRVAAANTHGALWNAATASIDQYLRPAPPGDRDEHSAYFPPDRSPGVVDSPADTARRFDVVGDTLSRALAPGAGRVAYLYFPGYSGKTESRRADSTLAVIRAVDQAGPCGWVLDQRRNNGGNIAAMFSGLHPLIGDAPASQTQNGLGGFLFSDGSRGLLYLQNGRLGTYDRVSNRRYPYDVAPTTPYALRRPNSPVAILTSGATASAGELIALAFRGSAVPHRTFGGNTYGVTTGPVGIYLLPDSGYLNITASIMFDRLGTTYGGILPPDEAVAGPAPREITPAGVLRNGDPVLAAAVRWLQAQPACAGAAVASRAPSAERAAAPPAAARLPGVDRPARLLERVGKYFVTGGAERALDGR